MLIEISMGSNIFRITPGTAERPELKLKELVAEFSLMPRVVPQIELVLGIAHDAYHNKAVSTEYEHLCQEPSKQTLPSKKMSPRIASTLQSALTFKLVAWLSVYFSLCMPPRSSQHTP